MGGIGPIRNSSSIQTTVIRKLLLRFSAGSPSILPTSLRIIAFLKTCSPRYAGDAGSYSLFRRSEVQWCATDLIESLENCESGEPTESSCAFPKATGNSFHSCVLGTTKFACLTPRKPVRPLNRYFVWNCSTMTHKRQLTIVSATTSRKE